LPTHTDREAPTGADRASITEFYDRFTAKLIRDYVQGNVRQSRAFELVRSSIGPETRTVLDVGCGIGASSASYVEGCTGTTVHGVDISPNNIRVATALFGGPRLRFSVSDMAAPPDDQRYDLIALVDMHEHIPRDKWPRFHEVLEQCLGQHGTVVMTTPSPLHQQYLHEHKPAGLQVVDETLELEDVVALADRLGARIIRYDWIGVYHRNDYVHTVISRAPRFDEIPRRARWVSHVRPPAIVSRAEDLLRRVAVQVERRRRALRVRRTLGISIVALIVAAAEAVRSVAQPGHRAVPAWGQIAGST
jgi:2-polyprenyl-3-methyl-5-hydroxy-6-metoxy-1,4-benzoquinol methylase